MKHGTFFPFLSRALFHLKAETNPPKCFVDNANACVIECKLVMGYPNPKLNSFMQILSDVKFEPRVENQDKVIFQF